MLPYFVLIPILIAVFIYVFPFEKAGRIMALFIQAALLGFAIYLFLHVKNGPIHVKLGSYENLLGISLKADTLSSVLIMLGAFIFLIVAIYSYNEEESRLFWFLIFIWEGLLFGIFLTNDFFSIFVLLEVAAVLVAVLIMYKRDKRSMYDGMLYLMVNAVAAQFYLFGVGYIYKMTGVLDFDAVAAALGSQENASLILPYALIITAISLKCALCPLYGWLPRAHGTPGAPASVSALLSGLHIKSAVYLFIRTSEAFSFDAMSDFFLCIGILTGIIGLIFAICQHDIKLILAYSTISQIGLIIIGLNVADGQTFAGAIYHMVNHALFKSALFLAAGMIIKRYQSRDINAIRGVFRQMPLVGAATLAAILGITGAPLFNGSISKYFMVAGASWPVSFSLIIINLGTITLFIKYAAILFGRPMTAAEPDGADIKPDPFQQAAVLILGMCCFLGGIFGEQMIAFLFGQSVNVDAASYLEKVALFAGSMVAGYFIHKYYIKNSLFFQKVRGLELGFRGICVSMGVFFALVLVITRMVGGQ